MVKINSTEDRSIHRDGLLSKGVLYAHTHTHTHPFYPNQQQHIKAAFFLLSFSYGQSYSHRSLLSHSPISSTQHIIINLEISFFVLYISKT